MCVCMCVSYSVTPGLSQAGWAQSRGSWALPLSPCDTSLASWRPKPQVERRGVRDTHRLGLVACVQRSALCLADRKL